MILECTQCEAIVNADTLKHYDIGDPELGEVTRVHFLRCPQCERPLLAESAGWATGEEPLQLFPPRTPPVSKAVPDGIRRVFEEALVCFRTRAFTAAAVMCRKTLEGLVDHHNVTSRNLKSGLESLRDAGVIDARLFEWANELRLFGNEAAHGTGLILDRQDARDIVEFTNALLEYVFAYRAKFDEFRRRREKPSAG